MINRLNIEEIILHTLNEDTPNFIHLKESDRKLVAQTLSNILYNVNEAELEMKRKAASNEISLKLEHISELGKLHDKLKRIPFYKFSQRYKLKLEILDLELRC